jgi:signal transduction histidine kinase
MHEKEEPLSLLRRYGVSSAMVVLSIIITAHLPALSQASHLFAILAAIMFAALYGGWGPGLFTILISTIGIPFHLMDPRESLLMASKDDLLRFFLFVAVSLAVVFFVSNRQVVQARLARSNEELRRLTSRMETVREEERIRLAREIHDELGGTLSCLKLDVASVHKRIKDDKTIHDKTNDILKEIDGAILTVQRIATELRPSLLDQVGLGGAIEAYLDTHCRQAELGCEKDIDPQMNVETACATAMFRVFQEAFTNVIRHAKATKMTVQLKQDETGIRLVVADNGVGIDRGQVINPDALGLIGMRERMRSFGGTVTLIGRPGEGTTVTTVVPKASATPSMLIVKSATTQLPEQPNPA